MNTKIPNLLGENNPKGLYSPIFLVKIMLGIIFTKFFHQVSTVLPGCPTNDEGADFKLHQLSPSWGR